MRVARHDGRFTRAEWLAAALNVLSQEGQARLNVERLAAELGVTKGSFYHHFRNRSDFVEQLLAFWEDEYTDRLRRVLETSLEPPCVRLLQIMTAVEREELTQFDTAFRSWAAQDDAVARVVRRVDTTRFETIKAIFAEIGFTGDELVERTSIWLLFHSSLSSVYVPDSTPLSDQKIRSRLHFFTSGKCS